MATGEAGSDDVTWSLCVPCSAGFAEWDPHTVSCIRLNPGEHDAAGVGAEYEPKQKIAGRTSTVHYRVWNTTEGGASFSKAVTTPFTREEMLFRQYQGRTGTAQSVVSCSSVTAPAVRSADRSSTVVSWL